MPQSEVMVLQITALKTLGSTNVGSLLFIVGKQHISLPVSERRSFSKSSRSHASPNPQDRFTIFVKISAKMPHQTKDDVARQLFLAAFTSAQNVRR